MFIRDVKKQPELASVEFEAEVKNCSATILDGGEYTQCVNLTDHTGTIRARFSYGGKSRTLCRGTLVKVITGVRKAPGVAVLSYTIPTTSEPEPGSLYEYKPDDAMTKSDWEAKDRRMCKCNALNNATQTMVMLAGNMELTNVGPEEIKEMASDYLAWIYE